MIRINLAVLLFCMRRSKVAGAALPIGHDVADYRIGGFVATATKPGKSLLLVPWCVGGIVSDVWFSREVISLWTGP